MRSRAFAVAGFLIVSLPLTAAAGEPRSHDGGFFLRLAPGGGFTSSTIDDSGDSLEVRGSSGSFDIALGAVISPNFAVHATLGGWGLVDPTIEFNGVAETAQDVSLTMSGVGAGFTYYLGDSNTYVTASAMASTLTLEIEGESDDSGTGFAVDAGIGKEWWVSDRWGLGISATAGYHSIPPSDAGANGKFKGPSFAVRFSATMN